MSRIAYVLLSAIFFFCIGCTPSSDSNIVTTTPVGYSAPVAISSLAKPQEDDRSWEQKAEAIMKIADQEAEAEAVKAAAPIQVIKIKAAPKTKRVAHGKKIKAGKRQVQKRAKLKGNLALH